MCGEPEGKPSLHRPSSRGVTMHKSSRVIQVSGLAALAAGLLFALHTRGQARKALFPLPPQMPVKPILPALDNGSPNPRNVNLCGGTGATGNFQGGGNFSGSGFGGGFSGGFGG